MLKDGLVILTIAFLAIYLPLKLFGGYGELFTRLRTERPEWLTLPGNESPGLGVLWFMSTCILNGVTFTVFPSFVAGYLGSKSPNTIRRNAIFLPMYSLLLLVPVMLGMAALFVVPNLETNDLALLTMVTQELPAWVVALVGVAGALQRDRPDGRVHALHRHAVGDEERHPRADGRGRVRPRRAGRRAAASRTRSCGCACSPTRASRSSSRRSSAACCGGG